MSTQYLDTAARHLVDVLVAEDVSYVFCVPGESYLAVLDALVDVADKIQVICCRHEASAANMAAAYGKLTGKPGVCMVTRGPGATQASVGVHTAQQDSAPMILFVGQVALDNRGLEAFQELDYVSVFHSMAKWVVEIDRPSRTGQFVSRAFAIASQGRPGPVVVALPEDVLTQTTSRESFSKSVRCSLSPSVAQMECVADRLARARRPLLILGGGSWTADSLSRLAHWCRDSAIPVALSFRRKDLMDNGHPFYAGDLGIGTNPKLIELVRQSDLILAVGARLGEITSQGFKLFTRAETKEKLIHIYPDATEIGRIWPASLGIAADSISAAAMLSQIQVDGETWREWASSAHTAYEEFAAPVETTGPLNLSAVFHHLQQAMPDAIVCNGAGNYTVWLHRFYRHRYPHTQLGPVGGAMGFGLPAAIAAKLAHSGRHAIAVAGDGCFMMASQELATAVQYNVDILVLIVDNGSFGTIRMHQERDYPDRVVGTNLQNPDFVKFSQSFGCWARLVEKTEDFPNALTEARLHSGVSVLHLKTSLNDIAPGRKLHTI